MTTFTVLSQIKKDKLLPYIKTQGEIIIHQATNPESEMTTVSDMTKIRTGDYDYVLEDDTPHINGIVCSMIDELAVDSIEDYVKDYNGFKYISNSDIKYLIEMYDEWYELAYDLAPGEYIIKGKTVYDIDAELLKQRARQLNYFKNTGLPLKVKL